MVFQGLLVFDKGLIFTEIQRMCGISRAAGLWQRDYLHRNTEFRNWLMAHLHGNTEFRKWLKLRNWLRAHLHGNTV